MVYILRARRGIVLLAGLALWAGSSLRPDHVLAGTFLFVSDFDNDREIAAALAADGHVVTVVTNDYVAATRSNPALVGPLSGYDAVFWSAAWHSDTGLHAPATFAALETYVILGGNVFVTGFEAPNDPGMTTFLGAGGFSNAGGPGPISASASALSTGAVDVRGVTPTSGGAIGRFGVVTAVGPSVTVVATTASVPSQAQWLVRQLGPGRIAYVAAGNFGSLPAWTNTAAGGAGAYNAALRNFAFATARTRVLFVSDAATDTNIPVALTDDEGIRVITVVDDYLPAMQANPTLEGALGSYEAVVWSASGNTGRGASHRAATTAALTDYATAGGYVFVTGTNALTSPFNMALVTFVGGTGAVDRIGLPNGPNVITGFGLAGWELKVGRVDIRGVTPTNGGPDFDALTGFGAGVTVVSANVVMSSEALWTIRSVGSGRVAFVSNGEVAGAVTAHPSWTQTFPGVGGDHAYNAVLRNFVLSAQTAVGPTRVLPGGACTTATLCTRGFCVDGVCCDTACGGGVTSDCQACSTATGTAVNGTCGPVRAFTTCRDQAGPCDAAEACNGTLLTCPTDTFAPAGSLCRSAAGTCDRPENCTGTSAVCPMDAHLPVGATCRVAADQCDVPELCVGAATCPADALYPSTTLCRGSADRCDVPESCSGTSVACPADSFAAAGAICRMANSGGCDVPEQCTGVGIACPVDVPAADGSECGVSTLCGGGSQCLVGVCAMSTPPLDCDDASDCTVDSCMEGAGCAHEVDLRPAGCCDTDARCNDFDECTADVCRVDRGLCVFEPIGGCGEDAGIADLDAGAVDRDGGAFEIDGGELALDGGLFIDAGPSDVDAGLAAIDAGRRDAAEAGSPDGALDAGPATPPDTGGCSCAAPGTHRSPRGIAAAFALSVAAFASARRRRMSQRAGRSTAR